MKALDELLEIADGWVAQSGGSSMSRYARDDIREFVATHHGLYDLTDYDVQMGVSDSGTIVLTATPKKT